MIHKLLLLFFFFFIGWIFPPVFAPAGFSVMGLLIAQGFPNVLLVIIIALAMITSYLPLWWLAGKILYKHKKENLTKIKVAKKKHKETFIRNVYDTISEIIRTALHSEQFRKLTEYLESKTGKWILFSIMVFLCTPILSNVIAVLILRKRISLKRLMLIASIGETIGAFAFVYGGIVIKWITQIVIQSF